MRKKPFKSVIRQFQNIMPGKECVQQYCFFLALSFCAFMLAADLHMAARQPQAVDHMMRNLTLTASAFADSLNR